MNRNLKLSYILFFVFSAIIIAWQTLTNFFGGVGINFIALLALIFITTLKCLEDKELFKRLKDIFIIASSFCLLELVIYFACEFGYGETIFGFIVYQNIISFLAVLFAGYLCFRFLTEYFNKKIKFVEVILGNEKISIKPKKAKEFANGSLEDKPNKKQPASTEIEDEIQPIEEETEIIIETEE